MNLIREVTKTCERTDCSLTESGGVTTCMGFAPTYDKYGTRTDRGDPNIRSWSIRCSACKREWVASEQYSNTAISERVK